MTSRGKVIYEKATAYSLLQVVDKKNYRYLVFLDPAIPKEVQKPESIYQGYMDLHNPHGTSVPFADYLHLAWIFHPHLKDILMIGLGAGTVPKRFLTDYPEIFFTSVEIDPDVVEVASKYFYLPINARHRVVVEDGRAFLDTTSTTSTAYDLLLLDAFYCQTIPYHLYTAEFFSQAQGKLNPGGLVGINFGGTLTGPGSILFRSLYKTLTTVLPQVYVFARKKNKPHVWQNIQLFASTATSRLTPAEILGRAQELAKEKITIHSFVEKAKDIYPVPLDYLADATVLIDNNAPASGVLSLASPQGER